MAFFPIIVKAIPSDRRERELMICYGFVIRALRLSDEEFNDLPREVLRQAITMMRDAYYNCFGKSGATYNSHITCSHLEVLREQYNFNQYSAYPFEALYSEMRRSFFPGTGKYLF